jgi:hypothetical protein
LLRDDDVRALVVYQSRKYVKRALSLTVAALRSSFMVNAA